MSLRSKIVVFNQVGKNVSDQTITSSGVERFILRATCCVYTYLSWSQVRVPRGVQHRSGDGHGHRWALSVPCAHHELDKHSLMCRDLNRKRTLDRYSARCFAGFLDRFLKETEQPRHPRGDPDSLSSALRHRPSVIKKRTNISNSSRL